MKSFMAYISHLPKRTVLIMLALMSVFMIGAIASASFGPDRPTKAWSPGVTGFDYVTFNSFTGVPDFEDEREFFSGQIMGDGVFYDPVANLRDGDEVMVRVYVHNNADGSLNASGEGIAKNTKVRVELPTGSHEANSTAKAYISADNAKPQVIWDELDFSTENGGFFELDPIAGSATYLSNFIDKPINLDQLLGSGVSIGDDALDGEIRGCFEYDGVVTFKVKVKMPRYTLQKQVRQDGETSADWRETATVKSGDTVEWGMEFTNTGSTELKSVKIVDEVPTNTKVVEDSVRLYNGNYPSGYTYPNSAIQAGGTQVNVDIGNYLPTINGWVLFKTVVDPYNSLGCGVHELINNAFATPDGYGAITNGAKVIVDNGECKTQSLTCTALSVATIDENSWKFTASASAKDGASITGYDFNVNGDSKQNGSSNMFNFATNDPGKYTVQVYVNGKVDGKDVSRTSDACKQIVEVREEPTEPVYQCTSLTAVQSASNRLSFAFTTKVSHSDDVSVNKYIYDFGVAGEDKVHTDKSQITKVYEDYGKYNVNVEVLFNVGKAQKSKTCSTSVEVMKTPPVEPPVTPPTEELPNTGPAQVLAGLFGTGALSYGAVTLRASRSGLRNTLLGKEQD